MFGGPNDGVNSPWQATFFGVWEQNSETGVVLMQDREMYKNDWIGLRTLNEQGRIHQIQTDFFHLDYLLEETFFKESIVPWLHKDE